MIFVTSINQYLDRTLLKGDSWIVKTLIFIIFLSICLNYGFDLRHWAYIKNFVAMVSGGVVKPELCCYYWSDIDYQTTDILMQRLQVWDTVHQANMRFRPVLPVLWMIFHSVLAIYALQILLGIGQLYMTIRLIYNLTMDRLQAFYFTVGFAGLYTGAAFYLDFYGFGDAFAYAFMMAALFFRQPLLIFSSIFLATCVDERTLVNAPFIILFHIILSNKEDLKQINRTLFRLPIQAWAVLLGGAVYLGIRIYLTLYYHLKTPFGGPSLFFFVREASKTLGLRVWSGFESFWLLIVIMLFLLYNQRHFLLFAVLLFFTGITIFTTLMQGDHTRTEAYGFPVFFVAMLIIRQQFSREELRSILLYIALIAAVFFPIVY